MTKAILAAMTLLAPATVVGTPATAATRTFAITSFDRVRVEGPYKVTLATGVAPYATATGSQAALDAIALDVQGNTLVVHVNRSSWGGFTGTSPGPATIALGTHDLAAAWLNGSGSLAIDRVKALGFDLSINGSGLAEISQVTVDQLRINIGGAGSARLDGAALRMTAFVRGASSLDASALSLKDATITAEGPAVVKAAVSDTAKVEAYGVASVSLTGAPACTVRTTGSSAVDGCKSGN